MTAGFAARLRSDNVAGQQKDRDFSMFLVED
jgi:hypothetical protein